MSIDRAILLLSHAHERLFESIPSAPLRVPTRENQLGRDDDPKKVITLSQGPWPPRSPCAPAPSTRLDTAASGRGSPLFSWRRRSACRSPLRSTDRARTSWYRRRSPHRL